jgi:AcrR family transcriptional regulator
LEESNHNEPGADLPSQRTKPTSRRKRNPRGTLNPEIIVDTAIAVIAADGLDALTLRRLADDLGVPPTSLYTHFRDKEAILKAVSSDLYGRFEMPRDADSDVAMLGEIMRAYFRLLIDNPVLLQMETAIRDMDPAELRVSEGMYQCLQRLGLDHRKAVGLLAVLLRFVFGSAYIYPFRRSWDEDPEQWDRIRRRWAALPADAYPSMRAIADDLPQFTQHEVFELGLTTLLKSVQTIAEVELTGETSPDQDLAEGVQPLSAPTGADPR